ncbi:Hypothetical predicted protein [Scomber scombrus]|uniref:Uncharacterized protein n=1 Tax=Scomber scombrus TaxID=13677 RepID=A0AAV1NGQ0_SCOSC
MCVKAVNNCSVVTEKRIWIAERLKPLDCLVESLVSVPSLLLSFYENFQSCQWDTKWKTSFEFQRPDRTHCLYQQSKGPLDKKVPSELIIHAESPPEFCFLSRMRSIWKPELVFTGTAVATERRNITVAAGPVRLETSDWNANKIILLLLDPAVIFYPWLQPLTISLD